MNFCLDFALENRKTMINIIKKAIEEQYGKEVSEEIFINRNHNHAELKDGFIIHRKGATHSEKDMLGVIPANMKDGSFIVKGKGSELSMNSSSHGAGRVLSRKQAKETLDVVDFHKSMEGIITNHTDSTIDESPKAYKDIFEVMELQKDLVEILDRSIPILNIKG
jgi:tRNA-splicing ligase RtcB